MPVKFYYVADLEFEYEEDPLATGDAAFIAKAPFDGEILSARTGPCITGTLNDAGSGAGEYTEIQIRNVDTGHDYFLAAYRPRFYVDQKDASGRVGMASGSQLATHRTFRQNEELSLDVDTLPSTPGAYMHVWLTCGFWRTVD